MSADTQSTELNSDEQFILHCFRAAAQLCCLDDMAPPPESEWERIVETLVWHKLLPLVHEGLPRSAFSPTLRNQCRTYMVSVYANYHKRLADFDVVRALFDSAQIPYAPVKGIANSFTIYKDLPRRAMYDIDVLVRAGDVDKAYSTLFNAGFRPPFESTRHRWHYDLVVNEACRTILYIKHPNGRVVLFRDNIQVDLHADPIYGLGECANPSPQDYFWEGARPDEKLGGSAFKLSDRNQLLLQTLHASGDECKYLMHAMDVIRLKSFYNLELDYILKEPWLRKREHIEKYLEFVSQICLGTIVESSKGLDCLRQYLDSQRRLTLQAEKVRPKTTGKHAILFHASVLRNLCLRSRFLYVCGFFIPNAAYYSNKSTFEVWFAFYIEFMQVFKRIGRSIVTGD